MVKIRYLLLLLSEGVYRIRFIVVKSLMEEATYKEIQEYVKNKYDLHVTNLYIAQVKREFGIIERENYNTGEGKAKVPQVTAEKREAIIDALKYFQMIE